MKPLRDMGRDEREEMMAGLAEAIAPGLPPDSMFTLLVFEEEEGRACCNTSAPREIRDRVLWQAAMAAQPAPATVHDKSRGGAI